MATVEFSRNDTPRSRIQAWSCFGLVGACLALTLVSSPLMSLGTWNQFGIDMFGWLTFVGGAALRWWSALFHREEQPPRLATSGPYSICRHPAQLGNLLFCVSLACFLGSLTCLVGFAVGAIGFLSITLPAEERDLREVFGGRYDRYCQRVPRLWPRLRFFHSPENFLLDVGPLVHELRWTAVWMWLPVLGKAAAQCRAEAWWPHFFGLP